MGRGGDPVSCIRWDADTGSGQLIVVNVGEDVPLLGLGVQPGHIIELARQHQVVMMSCD